MAGMMSNEDMRGLSELSRGSDPEALAMAQRILDAQLAEITEMWGLLRTLDPAGAGRALPRARTASVTRE